MSYAFEDFKQFLETLYSEIEINEEVLKGRLEIIELALEGEGVIYKEKYEKLYFQILALSLFAFDNISSNFSEGESVSLKIGEVSISTSQNSGSKTAENGNLDYLKEQYKKLIKEKPSDGGSSSSYSPFLTITSI
jgi:hypothetical protein